MADKLSTNPFLNLFASSDEAEKLSKQLKKELTGDVSSSVSIDQIV